MQFDRAMALLLEGHKVQRPSWVRDDGNTHLKLVISGDEAHVIREGTEIRFTRPISITRDGGLGGGDLAASDWMVISDETQAPAPNSLGIMINAEEVKALLYGVPKYEFSTALSRLASWLAEQDDETPTPPGNQIRTAECDGKDAVPMTGQLPVGTASTPPAPNVVTAGQGVEVKPLKWTPDRRNLFADVPFQLAFYAIRPFPTGQGDWKFKLDIGGTGSKHLFGSQDEAKAAAQADYERRILSALPLPSSALTLSMHHPLCSVRKGGSCDYDCPRDYTPPAPNKVDHERAVGDF